jgi:UDP-glucose 4-epimerase
MVNSNLEEKKVLIIGGTGYIGSHLVKKIKEVCKEYSVIGKTSPYMADAADFIDIDIVDEVQIFNFFKDHQFDIIFHLAALISVKESVEIPERYFSVNATGTLNILEAIRKTQQNPKFIFNSTGLVYGNSETFPITENNPIAPNNPYAASKVAAEEIIEKYASTYGLDSTILRYFTIYGPNQASNLFIPSFIRRCLEDQSIKVGNLSPTRDFLFIEDAVSALLQSVKVQKEKVSIYNIASGIENRIEDVVEIILELTGRQKSDLFQDPDLKRSKSIEVDRISVDISKAKNELQWVPKTSLQKGLEICINHLKDE